MSLFFVQSNAVELITKSIDDFNESYHADYFSVRCLADIYLSKDHTDIALNNALACVLRVVLKRFGAEKKQAPTRKKLSEYTQFFSSQENHALLKKVHSNMTISDQEYINALNHLAKSLFTNNTNVTYPMKALMLLTGYNFALDSQVRAGLTAAGITGVSATQFLLPNKSNSLEGKKITKLSSMFYDFYHKNKLIIDTAVSNSNYKGIGTDIGRIFDVLLFMQEDPQYKVLTYRATSAGKWYD